MTQLTESQERLAKITAEAAARYVLEQGYPIMIKRERSLWRSIWNAVKHGAGIMRKEIDEAMKEE